MSAIRRIVNGLTPLAGSCQSLVRPRRQAVASVARYWRATYSSAAAEGPSQDAESSKFGPMHHPDARPKLSMSEVRIAGKTFAKDSTFNIPKNVLDVADRRLHRQTDHPVYITRTIIESKFPKPTFMHYSHFHPVVTTEQNFDSLGFPLDHPGRQPSDTYYVNKHELLRTHTSAHQAQIFLKGHDGYLISSDVYRRDEIDRSHFPVFHQMEGARVWDRKKVPNGDVVAAIYEDLERLPKHDMKVEDPNPPFHTERNPLQDTHHSAAEAEAVGAHLKRSLELMVVEIFSRAKAAAMKADPNYVDEPLQVRWIEAYFPFTSPSWELEVYYGGEWLELLGCGVVNQNLLINAGQPDQVGWAFGIGLERVAMLLFQIPDIRLFWSKDERFLSQFRGVSDNLSKLKLFVPFSKYPACPRDVSFWLPSTSDAAGTSIPGFHENDLMEIVRDVAGSTVEDVKRVDEFTHPKTGRRSMCYRINYRSLERTLTNEEVNELHRQVEAKMADKLAVDIRH